MNDVDPLYRQQVGRLRHALPPSHEEEVADAYDRGFAAGEAVGRRDKASAQDRALWLGSASGFVMAVVLYPLLGLFLEWLL